MSRKEYCLKLFAIVCFAALFRLCLAAAFLGLNSAPDGGSQPDQLEYESLAHHLVTDGSYVLDDGTPTNRRMPGTSLAIAPAYMVFGRNFAAARIWFCLLSALTCLATAWLANFHSRKAGLLAAAFLAVLPNHAYYSMHFVSEVPFALFITLATAATIVSLRRSYKFSHALIAGLLWGITALVRPNVILALPLLCGLACWRTADRRKRLKNAGVICSICVLLLIPWVARNQVMMGKAMLSSVGSYTFWGAHNEHALKTAPGDWVRTSDLVDDEHPFEGSELERTALAWKYGRQFVENHLSDMPYLTAMKFYRLISPHYETPNAKVRWSFAIGWLLAAPLFIVGSITEFRRDWWHGQLLWLSVWVTLGTTFLFYGSVRFRDAISPVYVAVAAIGLCAIQDRFRSSNKHPPESDTA